MLVKLTCRGMDFAMAVRRARRALAEFRIRGVSTNIPFLAGAARGPGLPGRPPDDLFIDERPELRTARVPADRGTKLLTYLAEVTVNQPHGPGRTRVSPRGKLPALDLGTPPPPGARDRLLRQGPEEFAEALREQTAVGRHRHHFPRRPPVAARHPGAHPRPPARGPLRRPD